MSPERFNQLISRAANAEWRLKAEYFSPLNNIDVASNRFDRFKNSTSISEKHWQDWLTQTGQTDDQILRSMDDVRYIGNDHQYPPWAQSLKLFIDHDEDSLNIESLNIRCKQLVYNKFNHIDDITPNVLNNLSKALARRIYKTIWQTAFLDLQKSCEDYFETYPAIGYQVGISISNFLYAYEEIFEHYLIDKKFIQEFFFEGKALGKICELQCDLGDPHNQGRNVVIFELENNQKVVYKPKNLAGTKAFLAISDQLNQCYPGLALHVRKILNRKNYGWEEYIKFSECDSTEDVSQWFFTLGATQRLLQLFGGRDFWSDNFISTKYHSAPIDIETLFQPNFIEEGGSANSLILRKLIYGPLTSGMIYMPTGNPTKPQNLGVFTPRQDLLIPLTDVTGKLIQYELPKYLATLNNHEVNPFDYEDEFINGYTFLSNSLTDYTNNSFDNIAGYSSLSEDPQRFIWRSTWDYYLLLDEISSESNARDGIEVDIHLQKIFRSLQRVGYDSPLALSIAKYEITSLLNRDIPFLQITPNDNSVWSSEGRLGFIDGEPTFSEYQNRLNTLRFFELEKNLQQLHTGISLSKKLLSQSETLNIGNLNRSTVSQSMVEELGDYICDLMVEGADGSLGMIAALYGHKNKNWYLGVLPDEGYSGLLGISVALAELYKLSGNERLMNASKKIASQVIAKKSSFNEITLRLLSRVARCLNNSELIRDLNNTLVASGNNIYLDLPSQFENIQFDGLIDTSDKHISWLSDVDSPNSSGIKLKEARERIEDLKFSMFDLVTIFEYSLQENNKQSSTEAMEICFSNYHNKSFSKLVGVSAEHAPCAVMGLAALILMFLRINYNCLPLDEV